MVSNGGGDDDDDHHHHRVDHDDDDHDHDDYLDVMVHDIHNDIFAVLLPSNLVAEW